MRSNEIQQDGDGVWILPLHGEPTFLTTEEAAEVVPGISRSEHVLRTAILDVLCSQPDDAVGGRLRQALIESREPSEHPEDRCEECREPFKPWTAPQKDWAAATGRDHGGPILCKGCFGERLRRR